MFERVIKLIGKDNLSKIKSKTVCIVGLGGVGGYALEGLVRSGIENFVLVDYDKIDISNLNRQIITTNNNIGIYKTDEAEKRILSINSDCKVIKLNIKLDENNLYELFKYQFDYLVDACDTVLVKEELIKRCVDNNIKIISSMGTGNKVNSRELEIIDIRKTSYDPLAKRVRKYVIDNKIKGYVPVVCSKEQGNKFSGSVPSMMFVPATSGILCAEYVIKDIISC